MNQLTIRGMDKELEQVIRHLADSERTSLNKAALRLMRRGAGLEHGVVPADNTVASQLDDFIGTWDAAQATEFDASLRVFETIDTKQWQ